MKIKLKPNKKIFAIFLLINAAGYNYENNLAGMHKVRKEFKQKILSVAQDTLIKKMVKFLSNLSILSDDYIRLANLVVFEKKHKDLFADKSKSLTVYNEWKKIESEFVKVVNSGIFKELYSEYCLELKKINDYTLLNFSKELNSVLNFFNLPNNFPLNICAHLNLLDSYNRGTNYYSEKKQIISFSLDEENKISWQTVRHEFMHILLKKIFKNELLEQDIVIPVNKNYEVDTLRVKFDENFILAANLFFIEDKTKRKNNFKFYFDRGFKKNNIFYSFIEDSFVKSGQSLSREVCMGLVEKLKTSH